MPPPEVRCLIVDDEEPGRVNLRYALAEHPHWTVVGECPSAASAAALLEQGGVDVVFLDIRMPGQSGMELARAIGSGAEPPLVIFVTAHDNFAIEAFEVHALDYLLKPIHDGRLAAALARCEAMLAQRQRASYGRALRDFVADAKGDPRYWTHLNVRSVGSVESVRVADVQAIEACGNYVQLRLAGRVILHRVALTRLLTHVDPADFIRVHRGVAVRATEIASLHVQGDGAYRLRLRGGDELPVSERYVALVRALPQFGAT